MTRDDMIANERHQAERYRREAQRRRANPTLVEKLQEWAAASDRRAEYLKSGPLFGAPE